MNTCRGASVLTLRSVVIVTDDGFDSEATDSLSKNLELAIGVCTMCDGLLPLDIFKRAGGIFTINSTAADDGSRHFEWAYKSLPGASQREVDCLTRAFDITLVETVANMCQRHGTQVAVPESARR